MANKVNDEDLISDQNWIKLNATASKSGYRDGISAGRDSNFQQGFDLGYREGFKNGFALGHYKGVLGSSANDVAKITRGNCVICANKELVVENNSLDNIIVKQTKSTDCLLEKLHKKYSETATVNLINKLE